MIAKDAGTTRGGSAPDDNFSAPLSYFYAAHLRHRRICAALNSVAEKPDTPTHVLHVLSVELADDLRRLDGAERLLFDLLRSRAEPEDDIARVLGILAADHEADRALTIELGTALRAAADTATGRTALAALIDRFVSRKLRTIALENAIVLPIARLRLTSEDLQQLSASLSAHQSRP